MVERRTVNPQVGGSNPPRGANKGVSMSKGSRPRPYSVSQEQFSNNYDAIFGKNKMQVKVNEDEIGKCGCGRSPTGKCIGWHGLNEQQLKDARAEFQRKLDEEESK